MLTVLFDTNTLHQEGLNSTRIQRLNRLIKASEVFLVVPEIVIKEYETKRVSITEEEFNKIIKSFNDLRKKNILQKTTAYSTEPNSEYSLNSMKKCAIYNINKEIKTWVISNRVEIYKISNTCIDSLFSSYFEGTGAFREKKKRDDIPDAVIFDAIATISKTKKLYVISKDKGIKNAMIALKNIESFDCLDDFLKHDLIKEKVNELDKKHSKTLEIIKYIDLLDFSKKIEQCLVSDKLKEIQYTYDSEEIYFSDVFDEIEINHFELTYVNTKNIKDFIMYSPNYLGGGNFSASVEFNSKSKLKFSCSTDNYNELPYRVRNKLIILSTDKINTLCASGTFDVFFGGIIVIENIDEESSLQEVKKNLENICTDQSSIFCKLDIEWAEVKK